MAVAPVAAGTVRFIDIGANMLDPMFTGVYRGKKKHDSDLEAVWQRARDSNVKRIIMTGTNLEESREALEMAAGDPMLYSTVGVHPTNTKAFGRSDEEAEAHVAALLELAQAGVKAGKVVAVGECGLDWARTHFSPKETQLRHFARHFDIAEATGLPLFLHDRETGGAFTDIVARNRDRMPRGGVVHSFTGTKAELDALLDLGLSIGINGCSLKTEENVAVAASVPLDRLMLETDAPWCGTTFAGVRPTHAGFSHVKTTWPSRKPEKFVAGETVKNRSEPAMIQQVAEVVAGAHGETVETIAKAAWDNTMAMFFPGETE